MMDTIGLLWLFNVFYGIGIGVVMFLSCAPILNKRQLIKWFQAGTIFGICICTLVILGSYESVGTRANPLDSSWWTAVGEGIITIILLIVYSVVIACNYI